MNPEIERENTDILNNDEESYNVVVKPSVAPVISYSMQQNGISLVKEIEITNESEVSLDDLVLEISSNPEITLPYVTSVGYVPAKKVCRVKTNDLVLDSEYLEKLTDAIEGQLILTLKKGEEVVLETRRPITLLAHNQWSGCKYYPEFLASFVTPSSPALKGIIARAREILSDWTGDSSIDAYESQDPNKVLKEAAAIFAAVKELEIVCDESVCNFEAVAQNVRLSSDILSEREQRPLIWRFSIPLFSNR